MRHLKKSTEIPVSLGAAIVALGVVYGDIGTSPMYVMTSIIAGNGGLNAIDDNLILGALSLVIWTVTPVSYTHLDVYKRQVYNRLVLIFYVL